MRYIVVILLLASPTFASDPVYSWKQQPDPDWTYLYQDGKFVGGWNYNTKQYRPFDGATWGEPVAAAPIKPPANRLIITPPATPQVMVMPQPASPPLPLILRGPLTRRATNIYTDIMMQATMQVLQEMPGAIKASIKESIRTGNYQLSHQFSVTPSSPQPQPQQLQQPQQMEVQPATPNPGAPARGPLRRLIRP